MKIIQILSKSWKIYKSAFLPLTVLRALNRFNFFTSGAVTNPLAHNFFLLLFGYIFPLLVICVIFKAWENDSVDLKNMTVPFTQQPYMRLFPITLFLLTIVVNIVVKSVHFYDIKNPTLALIINLAVIPLVMVLPYLCSFFIDVFWSIFVFYRGLNPFKYFSLSLIYILRHGIGYMLFYLVINAVPQAITNYLLGGMGAFVARIILSPVYAYLMVAQLGYIYENFLVKERQRRLWKERQQRVKAAYKGIE